jgi:two-component system NtrC family response regulator
MKGSILVVDDETTIQTALKWSFEEEGWTVVTAGSGEEAIQCLEGESFDVVIADILLPGLGGLDVLQRAASLVPRPSVILVTAYATVETAIEALRKGASDYVRKPFKLDDLKFRIRRLLEQRRWVEGRTASPPIDGKEWERLIVGESRAVDAVRQQVVKSGPTVSHVLITGETGTGKELVARAVHAASPRRRERFLAINCGAIPSALFESQLFGHVRGAFTGAVQASPGLFALADRGTFLLDEIGDLPHELQAKLLRVLEEKEVWPVGARAPVRIDTRVIASTNRDLRQETAAGRFREDLYYRLKVVHIALPPLRSRREDIPELVQHFFTRFSARLGKRCLGVNPDALRALMDHEWRGNVRELEHVVESAMIAGAGDTIGLDDLPPDLRAATPELSLKEATRRFERQHILDTLVQAQFDKREAARRMGVSLASLYRKLNEDLSQAFPHVR